MKRKAIPVSELLHTRPGVKLMHRFRSNVVRMTTYKGEILVVLESGKAYRSNTKGTRWYRIKPVATLDTRWHD